MVDIYDELDKALADRGIKVEYTHMVSEKFFTAEQDIKVYRVHALNLTTLTEMSAFFDPRKPLREVMKHNRKDKNGKPFWLKDSQAGSICFEKIEDAMYHTFDQSVENNPDWEGKDNYDDFDYIFTLSSYDTDPHFVFIRTFIIEKGTKCWYGWYSGDPKWETPMYRVEKLTLP